MKFENCSVYNFEGAFRGMRNPKNSWNKSDSIYLLDNIQFADDAVSDVAARWAEYLGYEWDTDDYYNAAQTYHKWLSENCVLRNDFEISDIALIGPNDMQLAKALISGGTEHRKFLRQIFVSVDITAPLYWWKEFDTYKVATVANSTSTMHKLTSKPITLDCFEIDDYNNIEFPVDVQRPDTKGSIDDDFVQMGLIPYLEYLRKQAVALARKDPEEAKKYWKELVRWLPNGWLQTRTWTGNYETLRSMYHQRKNHKLTEWHQFCDFIESLPYAHDLITD